MPDKMKWVKEWQCKAENDEMSMHIANTLRHNGTPAKRMHLPYVLHI